MTTDDTPPVDDEAAAAPDAAAAPTDRARTVSLSAIASVVVVIVLIAAVAFGVVQRGRVGDLEDERDARAAIATAAARFGEVYLTYDADDIESGGERVLELVSPEFAEDFSANRAPGIEELLANLGTSTDATASEVFVGDITADTARALVVVDIEATSTATGTQRLTDLSFVLELVRVDGRWLVDDVLPAPQPDVSGDGVDDPTASTTTTAP